MKVKVYKMSTNSQIKVFLQVAWFFISMPRGSDDQAWQQACTLFTNQRKATIPLLAFQLLNPGLGEISQWLEHWLFFHRS